MNQAERVIARALFRARVYGSTGQAYEDLFVAVLQRAVPGFRPVQPQGSKGDRKNDGYVRETGCYWQVYAPGGARERSGTAARKATGDFDGLKAFWEPVAPIRKYYFALNDRYGGAYPDVEEALAKLNDQHGLEACEPFLAKDLEDLFLSLSPDGMSAIIGLIPAPGDLSTLDYSALDEVIHHLMYDTPSLNGRDLLVVPPWDKKVRINNISEPVANILRVASYQIGSLEAYFRNNSRFLREHLRSKLRSLYDEAKAAASLDVGTGGDGDATYFYMIERLTVRREQAVLSAAHVVMAYFFEACDVFEAPLP